MGMTESDESIAPSIRKWHLTVLKILMDARPYYIFVFHRVDFALLFSWCGDISWPSGALSCEVYVYA